MVEDIAIDGLNVSFTVVLTTPACPLKIWSGMLASTQLFILSTRKQNVTVNMTSRTSSMRGSNQPVLRMFRTLSLLASGKGGVGKSTVAANLAVALAERSTRRIDRCRHFTVPSQHICSDLNTKNYLWMKRTERPTWFHWKNTVKVLSIGMLVDPNQAIPWRGPMASKALNQLVSDAEWGHWIICSLICLPEQVIFISLSFLQYPYRSCHCKHPQHVALADARKGNQYVPDAPRSMFLFSAIENMSYFTPQNFPKINTTSLAKGAKNMAAQLSVPFPGWNSSCTKCSRRRRYRYSDCPWWPFTCVRCFRWSCG